jgi:hypothetical protein
MRLVVLAWGGWNLKSFGRMEDAPILGIEGCQRKAYTALFGIGTEALSSASRTTRRSWSVCRTFRGRPSWAAGCLRVLQGVGYQYAPYSAAIQPWPGFTSLTARRTPRPRVLLSPGFAKMLSARPVRPKRKNRRYVSFEENVRLRRNTSFDLGDWAEGRIRLSTCVCNRSGASSMSSWLRQFPKLAFERAVNRR